MIDRPESQDYVAEVAAAYDAIGDDCYRYYRSEPSAVVEKYDRLILDGIVSGSSVLELGCGNGLPTTQKFARKFDVTTLDFSQKQIEKARQNVVGPRFLDADMSTVEFPEGSFDGVVAFSRLFICLATVRSACSGRYFLGSNWVVCLLGTSRSLMKSFRSKRTGSVPRCTRVASTLKHIGS